jgi:hypothetical protein
VIYTYSKVEVDVDNAEYRNAYVIDNIRYAPVDKQFVVYNIAGNVVASGVTTQTTILPVLTSGVYVIAIDGVSLKYMVK